MQTKLGGIKLWHLRSRKRMIIAADSFHHSKEDQLNKRGKHDFFLS